MKTRDYVIFFIILIIGFALRLDFLLANDFTIDSDEAIVGLMAKHIIEGVSHPVFYYGQHYLGCLESYCVAFLFKIFGISVYALKAVPLIFSLLFIVLVFFLTKEVSDKRSAFFAMLLSSVAPSSLIIWSGKARGGFIEVLVIGALALLFTFKWQKRDDKNIFYTFIIAGLLGLGWWINNQIIYFIPAIFLIYLTRILFDEKDYFIKKRLALYDHFLIATLAFFLGSILFWIYNFRHDFVSFEMLSSDTENFERFASNFFHYSIPIILGAKRYWQSVDIFTYSTKVFYAIHLFLIFIFALPTKNKIISNNKNKFYGISYKFSFFIIFASIFYFFTCSKYGSLYLAPRYLLPTYVILFPVLGIALGKISRFNNVVCFVFLASLLSLYLFGNYAKKRALLGEPLIFQEQRASDNHQDVISWLKHHKINVIRTNYWIGYRLAFETNEEVKFLMSGVPHTVRIKSYENLVPIDKKDTVPFLAVPREARYIRSALNFLGFTYKQRRFKNYRFIYNIHKNFDESKLDKIDNSKIYINVSDNDSLKQAINDDNIDTRWGSGRPQSEEMFVKFNFVTPQNVAVIEYLLGNYKHDYPRKLEIRGVNKNDEEKVLLTPSDYEMFSYYLGDASSKIRLKIDEDEYKSITFYQKGNDNFFDWSIAEMSFYSMK